MSMIRNSFQVFDCKWIFKMLISWSSHPKILTNMNNTWNMLRWNWFRWYSICFTPFKRFSWVYKIGKTSFSNSQNNINTLSLINTYHTLIAEGCYGKLSFAFLHRKIGIGLTIFLVKKINNILCKLILSNICPNRKLIGIYHQL